MPTDDWCWTLLWGCLPVDSIDWASSGGERAGWAWPCYGPGCRSQEGILSQLSVFWAHLRYWQISLWSPYWRPNQMQISFLDPNFTPHFCLYLCGFHTGRLYFLFLNTDTKYWLHAPANAILSAWMFLPFLYLPAKCNGSYPSGPGKN